MRLEQLYYLVEIAKYNSMSIAAEHMHIAQPSLSLSIKQLEEELNVKIFSRSRKGTFLTDDGQLIYNKVLKILEEIDDLYPKKYEELKENLKLLVSLSYSDILNNIASEIANKYKNLHLFLEIVDAYHINSKIEEWKNYDIILTSIESSELELLCTELSNFKRYIIEENDICLLASNKSSYSSQRNISFSSLKKLPLVFFSNKYGEDEFLLDCLEKKVSNSIEPFKFQIQSFFPNTSKVEIIIASPLNLC